MISDNIHQKCLPAVSSDIDRCGTVTACTINQITEDQVAERFGPDDDGDWTIDQTMFTTDYESKSCGVRENSLLDLIKTTRAAKPGRLSIDKLSMDLWEIRPFINVDRDSVLNNKRWIVAGGTSSGDNWRVDLTAQDGTDIPADTRFFPAGLYVAIEGRTSGGTETQTEYKIVSASNPDSSTVRLVLAPNNSNSFLNSTELTNPIKGVLVRGLPNVWGYEAWCPPNIGLNPKQRVPVWHETNRLSLCRNEIYEKRARLLRANNPQFRDFGDIETLKANRQAMEAYDDSYMNQWWFGKAVANQNLNDYQSLEQVQIPTNANLTLAFEGTCMGYKGKNIGVYEQFGQCNRIFQAQGRPLNLWDLAKMLYQIKRQRESHGGTVTTIDIFTDSFFKFQIMQGVIKMFNTITEGAAQYPILVQQESGKNNLGFGFDTYYFPYPGVKVAFISHPFFDDRVAANVAAGLDDKRFLWIVDWADIKTWVFSTDRVTNTSATNQELAKIDTDAACRMRRPQMTWEHTETTWANFVECPPRHAIITGLAPTVPIYFDEGSTTVDGYYTSASAVGNS